MWETLQIIEMLRKLFMTTLLAMFFQGDSSHLGGALLITFLFLLLTIYYKPYCVVKNMQQVSLKSYEVLSRAF